MKSKSKLISIIREYGIPPFDKELVDTIEDSIRLTSIKKDHFKLGESKFGGSPHLPKNISWPKISNTKYYSFLAQINLPEIRAYDAENILPKSGILYFFFDPDYGNRGKVIFYGYNNNLQVVTPPKYIAERKKTFFQKILRMKVSPRLYQELGMKISTEYYIPSIDSLRLERILLKENIKDRYPDMFRAAVYENDLLLDQNEKETTSNHHLLGIYNGIQHEYYESHFVKYDFKKPTIKSIDKALDWKLLLQIDSDNLMGWNWADWGKIYFFIYKDDLKKHTFENVRLVFDCY